MKNILKVLALLGVLNLSVIPASLEADGLDKTPKPAVKAKVQAKKSTKVVHKKAVQPSSASAYDGGKPIDMPAGHWANDEVMKLIEKGVIKIGLDGKFNGNNALSRYEAANMLTRMLEKTEEDLSKAKTPEELSLVKQRLTILIDAMQQFKNDQDEIKNYQKLSDVTVQKLSTNDKAQDEKISEIEKAKHNVKFFGDVRLRYQNSKLETNISNKTSRYSFSDRLRLGGTVPVDETLKANFRILMSQPVKRTDYGSNPFHNDARSDLVLDLLNIEKKNLAGGDWTLGRQYHKHGLGVVLLDFVDAVKYSAKMGKQFGFTGMLLAGNDSVSPGRSHGMDASMLSLEYKPNDKHEIVLYGINNNAERDKYGIQSTNGSTGVPPTPSSGERWVSLDASGKLGSKVEYFGAASFYSNELDEGNTTDSMNYLRGDTDNKSYLIGLKYDEKEKFNAGLIWGKQENNFHAFDVLTDIYYLDLPYHPLEDAIQAIALMSNGVFPAAGSTNPSSPLKTAAMGYRASGGAYQADIHGYSDLQLNMQYYFTPKLSLKLIGDFMSPADSKYDYRDISAITSRLRYRYNTKTSFEIRAVRVDSDYNRDVTDIRSELFMKF
ncbi:MAG: S-layer homology domain-containing protein [Candidatus Riflebacteria bacterium]|nr:S-layer homology domain-containing protein [Candidatus Riflebacteria bacterium]